MNLDINKATFSKYLCHPVPLFIVFFLFFKLCFCKLLLGFFKKFKSLLSTSLDVVLIKWSAYTLNALCHVTKTIMQPGSFVKALPIMNQSIENIES